MKKWEAKKFQLEGHNFSSTSILIDKWLMGLCYHGKCIWVEGDNWDESFESDWWEIWNNGSECKYDDLPADMKKVTDKIK